MAFIPMEQLPWCSTYQVWLRNVLFSSYFTTTFARLLLMMMINFISTAFWQDFLVIPPALNWTCDRKNVLIVYVVRNGSKVQL